MLHILRRILLTTLLVTFASQASAMFVQPDWWDVTEPGVGTNRYAYSMGDPVNKSDPSGHAVEWWETAQRFNYRTGTDAHKVLADYVSANTAFDAEKPFFNGSDPLWPALESAYRGRPDASRKTGPISIEVFDWKPVTHTNNAQLAAGDLGQQATWTIQTALERKNINFADTSTIVENGLVVGQVLGLPQDGRRYVYDVVTYSSKVPGIAYYDLRPTGAYQRTLMNRVIQDVENSFKSNNNNSIPLVIPLPILIPIP